MEQLDFFSIQPISCVFTGHRELKKDFSARKLKKAIKYVLDRGVTTFYNGYAVGFDTEALKIVFSFKKKYPDIKVVACIPCLNQEKSFSYEQKQEYYALLAQADEKVLVTNDDYQHGCMHKRNRYMADRADCMITYCRSEQGGTSYTVRYFKKHKPRAEIIHI